LLKDGAKPKNMKPKSVTAKGHFHSISLFLALLTVSVVSGCASYPAWLPSSGPNAGQVQEVPSTQSGTGIQIADVNDAVARKLLASQKWSLFSETFTTPVQSGYAIGTSGLQDARADVQDVFTFRYESLAALNLNGKTVAKIISVSN
jgi:hypothetical protein